MANLYWVAGSNNWDSSTTISSNSTTFYKWSTATPSLITGTWTNSSTTFTTSSSVTLNAGTQIITRGGVTVGVIASTATGTSFTLNRTPLTSGTTVTCFAATSLYGTALNENDSVNFAADTSYGVGLNFTFANCKNFTVTSGKVVFSGYGNLKLTGSLSLASGCAEFAQNLCTAFFNFSPTADSTITTNGIKLPTVWVGNQAGNYNISLADSLTVYNTFQIGGTNVGARFATNNYNITCSTLNYLMIAQTESVKSTMSATSFVRFGSSTITATYRAVFNGLKTVLNAGTSTLICSGVNGISLKSGSSVYEGTLQLYNYNRIPRLADDGYYDTLNPVDVIGISYAYSANPAASFNTVNLYATNRPYTSASSYAPTVRYVFSMSDTNTIQIATLNAVGTSPSTRILLSGIEHNFQSAPEYGAATKYKRANITINTAANLDDCNFADIYIGGSVYPITPTRAGNCGGTDGINFPSSKTVYWTLPFSQDRNWYDNAWAIQSGGNVDPNLTPLPQDTAIIDDFSIGGANKTLYLSDNNMFIGGIDVSSRTSEQLVINMTGICYVQKSILLGSYASVVGSVLCFMGREYTQTFKTNNTVGLPVFINNMNGFVNFLSDNDTINFTWDIILAHGGFGINGLSITCSNVYILSTDADQYYGSSKAIAFGDQGLIKCLGGVFKCDSIDSSKYPTLWISGSGAIQLDGTSDKSMDVYNLSGTFYETGLQNIDLVNSGTGDLYINCGTGGGVSSLLVRSISNSTVPSRIIIQTQTAVQAKTWKLRGLLNYPVEIWSYGAYWGEELTDADGNTYTDITGVCYLSKYGGGVVNTIDNIVFYGCRFTGTGTYSWYAGPNSTNGYNTTGITFGAAPVSNRGSFLSLLNT